MVVVWGRWIVGSAVATNMAMRVWPWITGHCGWRDYVTSSSVEQVCAFVSVEWFAVVEYRLMGYRS